MSEQPTMSSDLDTSTPQGVEDLYPEVTFDPALDPAALAVKPTRLRGSSTGWQMRLCYLCSDLLSILAGVLIGKVVVSWLSGSWWQTLTEVEMKFSGLFAAAMLIASAMSGSYASSPPRPARQFRSWTIGSLLVVLALLLLSWIFDLGIAQVAPELVVAATVSHLSACFLRAYCRIQFGNRDWWGTRVLIVGSNSTARDSSRFLLREPQWGLRPVGFLTEDETLDDDDMPLSCLGRIRDMNAVAASTGVHRAIVALHPIDLKEMREQFFRPDSKIRHWIVIPSSDYFTVLWSQWSETARMPSMSVSNRLAIPRARAMKRVFDLVVAGLISFALLPLVLLIAVLVRLTSKGPVFYKHRRVGRNGTPFKAWKFRTMVQDADETLARYFDENPNLREEWQTHQKLKYDPRITSVGRFLRATSLDELPQLWNVLVGEMSLVGPRPIVTSEANKYRSLFGHYQQVLPGITGLWQVSGRNDTTYKERIDLDVYYVENWSIWLDIYILACTVKVVLMREGAY